MCERVGNTKCEVNNLPVKLLHDLVITTRNSSFEWIQNENYKKIQDLTIGIFIGIFIMTPVPIWMRCIQCRLDNSHP